MKRAYPRKAQEDLRIPVSFSLSGERLKAFRRVYTASFGHEPTKQECRDKASEIALQAIDTFLAPPS
jgi:hypothetical protein